MRTRRRFEILWEPRLGAWAEDLGAIFARVPRTAGDAWSMRSFPSLKRGGSLAPARGLLASLLVHAGAFVLLSHASMAARVEPVVAAAAPDDAPIYLDLRALKELKILRALPVVTPPGPGGTPGVPGRAAVAPRPATQDPPQGSTATSPKFTIIVNPLKAESRTQAIHQSMAPPDLSIKVDQQLPDIVLADGPAAPKPQVDLQLHQPVARDPVLDSQAAAAPAIPSDAPQLPIKIAASVPQPKMPTAYFTSDSLHPMVRAPLPDSQAATAPAIPSDAPQLPIKIAASVPQPKMPTAYFTPDSLHPMARAPVPDSQAAAAPAIPSDAPQLPIKIAASVPQPKMPTAYFTSDSLHAPHDAGAAAPRKDVSADPSPDAAGGIVVMSAQPAPFSQLATLAQGNRYGAIAIAPSKPGPGSPGGKPNSAGAPAASGAGAGGDASVGVGAGESGGGGSGPEVAGRASFSAVGGSGTSGGVDANGLLAPVLPAAVFPVIIAPKLRHVPLVISAGPMGGGGLDVYGALTCGKVYSIFLPMPGRNWALQYCAHEASGAPPATAAPATAGVVQMQAGIVPPSPEQQFDFRRLPVPDKDGDKLIILQGTIAADGSVGSVRVFRGVLPEMDAEAAQAFGKWKFKPATRAGAAVALDVLVGVPARQPESASAAPPGVEISR
jgi:hypothetical protein